MRKSDDGDRHTEQSPKPTKNPTNPEFTRRILHALLRAAVAREGADQDNRFPLSFDALGFVQAHGISKHEECCHIYAREKKETYQPTNNPQPLSFHAALTNSLKIHLQRPTREIRIWAHRIQIRESVGMLRPDLRGEFTENPRVGDEDVNFVAGEKSHGFAEEVDGGGPGGDVGLDEEDFDALGREVFF